MFYFSSENIEIAGTSPETLVKLQNNTLYTSPLTGTRLRGKNDQEDKELEEELLNDEKKLAEHNMLVDLGRNDVGKISEFDSVRLEKYFNIEKFSHVMHIDSTITEKLRRDKDFLNVIDAILPAGTLSDAPKIRACEIINELEQNKRGIYGGQYIPETLMNELLNLEKEYNFYKNNKEFNEELQTLLNEYAGSPSLLYFAENMIKDLEGAKIYLKREDLNHKGFHKINNVLGQVLLAKKKMSKTRVIAETGAGQHGVATATFTAFLNMECEVFMGEEDIKRQAINVYRMELLGAKVHPVSTGTKTLKDAVSETMRGWSNRVYDTHSVLGSVMGLHPFQ